MQNMSVIFEIFTEYIFPNVDIHAEDMSVIVGIHTEYMIVIVECFTEHIWCL